MFLVNPIIFYSQEDKANKIIKETDTIFSEKQFGLATNDYKKVLGVDC